MGLSLKLTQNILKTFVGWKAQVLHDLHESVPYLYDNTVGDGPYNAWIDPILADEWQMIGWNNVSEMTKFGMPGVFAHGTFDTWSPGYLMFIAAAHNGISRLYETFGNAGADTVERTLSPQEYARTWYRQNPPLPKAEWSQRNNNNYQQTGLLTALSYFAANSKLFLRQLLPEEQALDRKAERPRVLRPMSSRPTIPRPGGQAELLRTLQLQGCEISRATAPFTVTLESKKKPRNRPGRRRRANETPAGRREAKKEEQTPETRQFPAGSYIVRMDQPYSRIADMLLDYQYWSPNDPQKTPYDDTGWTFGELGNVQVVRVTDVKVLDAPMQPVTGEVRSAGGLQGSGQVFVVNHNTDTALMTLRYRFRGCGYRCRRRAVRGRRAESSTAARSSCATSRDAELEKRRRRTRDSGSIRRGCPLRSRLILRRAARIALLHTWLSTQDEGWWRMAFDKHGIPYTYISTQDVAKDEDLNSKYDVILFPPSAARPQSIIAGMPMWGNALPWKNTPETPNIGRIDSTDDMRPGLGWSGLDHLQNFVRRGGLLIGAEDTGGFCGQLRSDAGSQHRAAPEVQGGRHRGALQICRSLEPDCVRLRRRPLDLLLGWSDLQPQQYRRGPRGPQAAAEERERPTGRGTPDDPDTPQARPVAEIPEEPQAEPWQAVPLTDEQRRNGIYVIPPQMRPRVVLRYADSKDLLVSGLLDGGSEIAQHPAVIDVPVEKGHVVLFSNNPMWRGETQGKLLPGVQRDPQSRPPRRRPSVGREVERRPPRYTDS